MEIFDTQASVGLALSMIRASWVGKRMQLEGRLLSLSMVRLSFMLPYLPHERIGNSVEFTAYLTSQMPRAAGSGSYSVDGGPAVTFPIPAWTSGFRGMPSNETIFRVPLFTTPSVSPGHHTLEVINLGNAETSPLSIDYIYVSHGDVDGVTATAKPNPPPAGTGTSSNPSSSTGTQTTTIAAAQKTNLGPIIGGVVGGVVVLSLVAFLLFLWRKRSKRPAAEVRLTSEEAWNLNMQSRDLAVATSPYDTGPTPPAYSAMTLPYEQSQTTIVPLEMTMNTTTGAPVRAIPPEKHRLLGGSSTLASRCMGSVPTTPSQSPPGSLGPPSQYGAPSDHSRSTNSSSQAVPGSVMPRRVPPRLPPKKS